ncbi:hypothetical protein PR048_012636 [Dryococelus australis]|uniref:Uncharacterized protein n=1 Tax=Dryococelus australis TaxID=614101 RepID=A0ABQ9HPY4_9NEOP|nr:hypothetical protein PR048_012636 [Dryococelus australis]
MGTGINFLCNCWLKNSKWTSRFWAEDKEVVSTYFTSVFLGHTTSQCLLQGFLKALSSLELLNILQVFMYGPNMDWVFLLALKRQITSTIDEET